MSAPNQGPQIGIIGARRVRQGLGPFVARDLREAGARVTSFLGTRPETSDETAESLARIARVDAAAYTDLDTMIAEQELDALVILSPSETHGRFLEAALEHGLHVLCEKPLLWGEGADGAAARALVDRFREAGLLLAVNAQWPRVLPALEELHPGLLAEPLRTFAMRLSPAAGGPSRVGDSLPHPLSLLQALAPGASRIEDISYVTADPSTLEVEFRFVTEEVDCACRVHLANEDIQPRTAWFAINGRESRRLVRQRDYAIFLTTGNHVIDVPDPLTTHVGAFVRDLVEVLNGGTPPDPAPLADRVAALDALAQAYPDPTV